MSWIAIAATVTGVIVTAWAVNTLSQARGILRDLRKEAGEFSDDHSRLVDEWLELQRKNRPKPVGPATVTEWPEE